MTIRLFKTKGFAVAAKKALIHDNELLPHSASYAAARLMTLVVGSGKNA